MFNYMYTTPAPNKFHNFHCDSIREFFNLARELASNYGISVSYHNSGLFLTSKPNGTGEQFQVCYWFKFNTEIYRSAVIRTATLINRHADKWWSVEFAKERAKREAIYASVKS